MISRVSILDKLSKDLFRGPKRPMRHHTTNRGFSFVELLVVMAVLGVITAIVTPQLLTAFERSRQRRVMADMRSIAAANGTYALDNGNVYAPTLIALQPFYMGPVPSADAWGNPWVYSGGANYTLTSRGSDGAAGPAPPLPWTAEPFEGDIIVQDGSFSQAPTHQ